MASIGLILFLIALIPVTRVDIVINTSFTLPPGTKYGPYDAGTYYHTRVWIYKTTLQGNILVEGEGVNIYVNGYNAGELRNIYVNGERDFTIEPADDQYTFTFDNTQGSATSLIRFTLREVWTASYSQLIWILGLIGLFFIVPGGLVISVRRTSINLR